MADQQQPTPCPHESAKSRRPFLYQKFADLLPPMWYNNDIDNHHIIRNQSWFLRENRFLFFTRNGPVEITLKPTTVLASAVICMVGVSVIFLSTIFASYSAIEVMRDESIQTAEASITTAVDEPHTTIMASVEEDYDKAKIWQGDIAPHIAATDRRSMISGKTATTPKRLPSRFNTQPQVNAPSLAELSGNIQLEHFEILPEITNTNDNQDPHLDSAPPKNAVMTNNIDSKEINNPEAVAPIIDLALATTPSKQFPRKDLSASQMPDQALNQMTGAEVTDTSPLTLSETNNAKYTPGGSNDEGSFVRTAAGFAIAMLPRLFSDPDPAPKSSEGQTQLPAHNGDNITAGPLDNGFAITAYSSQAGQLLPSISDAARAKKMLLSLKGEINYIRKSISQLGISADYLPNYDTAKTNTKDTDFKKLLITLAEHRAALRKIPFKTPMLYFYISSDYGYRKHPKTGVKTFHHGIDLAGTWQENVRSTAPGTVVFAGNEGGFGKVVRIEHDYGISTLYAHLSRITVRVGDYVGENMVIGKMGNTGRSAGAHLHYEIQVGGKSVDPSDFFTIGRQMSVSGELRQTSLTD